MNVHNDPPKPRWRPSRSFSPDHFASIIFAGRFFSAPADHFGAIILPIILVGRFVREVGDHFSAIIFHSVLVWSGVLYLRAKKCSVSNSALQAFKPLFCFRITAYSTWSLSKPLPLTRLQTNGSRPDWNAAVKLSAPATDRGGGYSRDPNI